jgi:tripartite-type tricarboxylate transporter receptor subunit TctC
MVVPFSAGTTSDVIARGLAHELSEKLGQPFVVENKGGAGGNIGAATVARAAADGYTILFATTGQAATNTLMYRQMEFDPQRDFAPVVLVSKAPVIITARPDAPYGSLKEFIDYAKANSNKTTAGFPGNGTLGGVDSNDSLLGANQIQGCFWGGSLGCEGPFGFERRGVGADGPADHRSTRSKGLDRA